MTKSKHFSYGGSKYTYRVTSNLVRLENPKLELCEFPDSKIYLIYNPTLNYDENQPTLMCWNFQRSFIVCTDESSANENLKNYSKNAY